MRSTIVSSSLWFNRDTQQLGRGPEVRHLRPKSAAVLEALLTQPGQVVAKAILLEAVWPDTAVSEAVLTVCINELRQLLGDTAQAPQYIETIPRRGYRWIGPLPTASPPGPEAPARPPEPATPVVGRTALLAQLHAALAQARAGTRQVRLLSGAAGLGKTTVVDTFLAQNLNAPGLRWGRGQCLDTVGEAYLPVLEALGQLGRAADRAPLVARLAQHAPHWLGQLPSLLDPATLDLVQRRTQGATPHRMLREGAEALEALSAQQPLVLILEDLHWSDHPTLDLLTYLAQRRGPAHLLLLGTYRPEDVSPEHPLAALILAWQLQGAVLPLAALTVPDITAYLAARGGTVPAGLAAALHQRTDGHPLFLVNLIDTLLKQGVLRTAAGTWVLTQPLTAVERAVPDTLRQLIHHQYTSLSPAAQRLVAAASAVGPEGTVAALGAALATDDEAVEATAAALLAQGQFLQPAGETTWPDGTVTTRYGFQHNLYHQVVYETLPVGQRRRWHRRLGTRLEAAYGAQASQHAVELMRHFTGGGDQAGSLRYGQWAAATALRRGAYAEALGWLRDGLAQLPGLPATPARDQQELAYLLTLGPTLIAMQGAAAPEVQQTYSRAQALSTTVGTPVQQYHALDGLRQHAEVSGAFDAGQALAEAGLSLAETLADPALLGQAHAGLGSALFLQGNLPRAQTHLQQGLQRLDAPDAVPWMRPAAAVVCRFQSAGAHWLRGFPDQARATMQQALAEAEALADPATLGWTLMYAIIVSYLCGDVAAVQTHATVLAAQVTAQDLAPVAALPEATQGWLAVQQGYHTAALAQMQEAVAAWQVTGRLVGRLFFFILLAECHGQLGQPTAGLAVLATPLADPTLPGQRILEAELYRQQGMLLAATGQLEEAETWLHRALTVARRQTATSLELRVSLALYRLAATSMRRTAARELLVEVYGRFTEGFDTADLQAARACLEIGLSAAPPGRQ